VSVGRARRLALRFALNESATLRIVPRRLVAGRLVAARGAIVRQVKAGSGSVPLAKQLRRLRLLRPGRISFAVTATDAAGNRSQRKAVKRVLRR
jgi:hypothetical protein